MQYDDNTTRRAVLAAAAGGAAVAASAPARAQQPRAKGPLVWLDMDQQALDDAYDQIVYAPNREQVAKRRIANSERARAAIGAPERVAYGATEIEKLDIYRTRQANAPVNIFVHGGAWRANRAADYACLAEPFVRSGAHFVILDFTNVDDAGGSLFPMVEQVRRAVDEDINRRVCLPGAVDVELLDLSRAVGDALGRTDGGARLLAVGDASLGDLLAIGRVDDLVIGVIERLLVHVEPNERTLGARLLRPRGSARRDRRAAGNSRQDRVSGGIVVVLHGRAAFVMVPSAGSSWALSRRRSNAASRFRHAHGCPHRSAGAWALW